MSEIVVDGAWILEADMEVSGDMWKNSIAIVAGGTTPFTPPLPTDTIVTAWKTFVLDIHFPDVTLNQLVLRPAIQRIAPFTSGVENPPIWTKPEGVVGNGNTTWGGAHFAGYLPKDAVIYAKKATSGGRSGKNFFRNILTEADVQSTLDGSWAFSPHSGGFDPAVFNSTASTDLGPFLTSTIPGSGYIFGVLHLMTLKAGDTRPAKRTPCASMTAVAPAWNSAHR